MERFIKLVTEEALDKAVIRVWFNCVIEHAPSGIVHAVTVEDDDRERHVVKLIHQTTDSGRHWYVIPLTRDLHANEVDHIVEQFAELQPELDFDVEINVTRLKTKDDNVIPLDAAKHLALCTAFAKQKHEDWLRDRTTAGWRYGNVFDADEKTHPLLRPWDQIPDQFKNPDLSWPQQLVSMLNDNGYVVISRDELDRLVRKAK